MRSTALDLADGSPEPIICRNATMKLAVVTRRSLRLHDGLAGPDIAGEYTDGDNTYAKLYRVR